MHNQFVCLEGTLSFDEDFSAQTLSFINFRNGQRINVNRDPIAKDKSFLEHVRQQLKNSEKAFNQVKIDKLQELEEQTSFIQVIAVVFSFLTAQNKRVWQATYACQISSSEMISFTSFYPDEVSRLNEIRRLKHCALHFVTHAD